MNSELKTFLLAFAGAFAALLAFAYAHHHMQLSATDAAKGAAPVSPALAANTETANGYF